MVETKQRTGDSVRTPRSELTKALAEGGMDDFHVVSEQTAREVLTDRRRELMDALKRERAESVTALADRLGRDKAAVSRDLATLAENGIVVYETDGRRKRPVLTHDRVVVEPIL